MRRTACCTAARLRARPASSTPVPRPTHAAVSPPASAADRAADGVVLPIPISPSTSRSPSRRSTAATATPTISSKRSGVSAASKRMSPVGRPMPTSTASTVAPGVTGEGADRRAALPVGLEHRRRHRRRVGADGLGRGDAVVAGEDQPDGTLDPRPVRAVPTGDPLGQLVEPRQRAAGTQDLRRPLVHRRGRHRVGVRQVAQHAVQRRHASSAHGSSSASARPATSSSDAIGARGEALVDPARGRRGSAGRARSRGARRGRPRW